MKNEDFKPGVRVEVCSSIYDHDWNNPCAPKCGDVGTIHNTDWLYIEVAVDGKPCSTLTHKRWLFSSNEIRLARTPNDWDDCLELL